MVKKQLHILIFFVLAFAGFLCNANTHAVKQKKNRSHKDLYEQPFFGMKFNNSEKIQSENKIDDSLQQIPFGCFKLRQACDFVAENSIASFECIASIRSLSKKNGASHPDFIEQKSLLYCYPFLAFW